MKFCGENMSKTHELKIYPKYFEAILDGKKTFEIRKDDPKRR